MPWAQELPDPVRKKFPRVRYTYADYLKWDEDTRAEIIDGRVFMMAAPNREHQRLLGELYGRLWAFLGGKPCQAYPAPFSVRLAEDTVLEPDITVVCDPARLDAQGCVGAPDFVIEILSPSTAFIDNTVKLQKYREAGVKEYWIVDGEKRTVQVNLLRGGLYVSQIYGSAASLPVSVLGGCVIHLKEVFLPF